MSEAELSCNKTGRSCYGYQWRSSPASYHLIIDKPIDKAFSASDDIFCYAKRQSKLTLPVNPGYRIKPGRACFNHGVQMGLVKGLRLSS
eukprot:6138365-Amphidinium_carterae.1